MYSFEIITVICHKVVQKYVLMRSLITGLIFIFFVQASPAQESYLLVSSGGGFAGTATVYKISLNGRVMKGKGLGDVSFVEGSKLKKRLASKYFKNAKAIMASSSGFSHPGNLYFSIALYEKGKESKITWGDAEHAAPEAAKELYQKINEALAKLTFK
jgi:hypothetical protein